MCKSLVSTSHRRTQEASTRGPPAFSNSTPSGLLGVKKTPGVVLTNLENLPSKPYGTVISRNSLEPVLRELEWYAVTLFDMLLQNPSIVNNTLAKTKQNKTKQEMLGGKEQ